VGKIKVKVVRKTNLEKKVNFFLLLLLVLVNGLSAYLIRLKYLVKVFKIILAGKRFSYFLKLEKIFSY
jgi:hypothetical protein